MGRRLIRSFLNSPINIKMLPCKKIYIDTKHKTIDSISNSNFKWELPETLTMPHNTIFYVDDICIPHSWYGIEENVNDKIYMQLTSNASSVASKPNDAGVEQCARRVQHDKCRCQARRLQPHCCAPPLSLLHRPAVPHQAAPSLPENTVPGRAQFVRLFVDHGRQVAHIAIGGEAEAVRVRVVLAGQAQERSRRVPAPCAESAVRHARCGAAAVARRGAPVPPAQGTAIFQSAEGAGGARRRKTREVGGAPGGCARRAAVGLSVLCGGSVRRSAPPALPPSAGAAQARGVRWWCGRGDLGSAAL